MGKQRFISNNRLHQRIVALCLIFALLQAPGAFSQNLAIKNQQLDTTVNQIGKINGKIVDNKQEPIIGATIEVFQCGIWKGYNSTDFDGNYSLQHLTPGKYDVSITFYGYAPVMITDVTVSKAASTVQNATLLHTKGYVSPEPIRSITIPFYNKDEPTKTIFRREQINQMPR